MSTEELLSVRYKVIADYPGNNVEVGRVFTSYIGEYFNKFKANFKKLKWHEDRNPDEMIGLHFRVCWPLTDGTERDTIVIAKEALASKEWGLVINNTPASLLYPATEKEYIDYQNSLKKQK